MSEIEHMPIEDALYRIERLLDATEIALVKLRNSEIPAERARIGFTAASIVALRRGMDALREKQEREDQEACEYCNDMTAEDTKFWNKVSLEPDNIKFCPMCGRRLSE